MNKESISKEYIINNIKSIVNYSYLILKLYFIFKQNLSKMDYFEFCHWKFNT